MIEIKLTYRDDVAIKLPEGTEIFYYVGDQRYVMQGGELVPYASDKQRRFMHAQHPDIAKRWDDEEKRAKSKKSKPAKKRKGS